MKVLPISTCNAYVSQSKQQNQNFGMSVKIERTAHNCIAEGLRSRVVDPIEWLATVNALAKDKAHYLITRSENNGFLNRLTGNENFVITRIDSSEGINTRISSLSELVNNVLALDPRIKGEIKQQKLFVDNNIIANTEHVASGEQRILTDNRQLDLNKSLTDQATEIKD